MVDDIVYADMMVQSFNQIRNLYRLKEILDFAFFVDHFNLFL